ncbi:MAG: tetratricopeptide repeat protein [Planctomycetota bacterium]|nr:tetratricopeptide repeat protein [Planctomycetota bacterium]
MADNPPAHFNSWLLVARSYEQRNESEKAVAIYKYLQDGGDEPHLRFARLRLALLYDKLGEAEQLIRSAEAFADNYPEDAQTPVLLSKAGDAAIETEDFARAVELYSRALKTAEADVAVYARYRRAVAYYLDGQMKKMAGDLAEVLPSPHSKPFRDRVLLMLGDFEQENDDLPKAIIYYKRLVTEHPDSERVPTARLRLGSCYYQRGMKDDAVEQYFELVRTGRLDVLPDDVLLWMVQYLRERERFMEAATVCRSALDEGREQRSTEVELSYNLGLAMESAGKYEEASRVFRSLVASYPDAARRYHAKLANARCLIALGSQAEAEKILRALLDETSARMRSRVTLQLADLEYSQGRFEEAFRDYSFVAILENFEELAAPALLGAARSSFKLERFMDASRFANELIERFPDSPLREEARRYLRQKEDEGKPEDGDNG